MILARVVGSVVSTVKHKTHKGHTLMIVQPIDECGKDVGTSFLSFDSVSAGPGDVVLCSQEGNTARQLLGTKDDPFHSVILSVVDQVAYTK